MGEDLGYSTGIKEVVGGNPKPTVSTFSRKEAVPNPVTPEVQEVAKSPEIDFRVTPFRPAIPPTDKTIEELNQRFDAAKAAANSGDTTAAGQIIGKISLGTFKIQKGSEEYRKVNSFKVNPNSIGDLKEKTLAVYSKLKENNGKTDAVATESLAMWNRLTQDYQPDSANTSNPKGQQEVNPAKQARDVYNANSSRRRDTHQEKVLDSRIKKDVKNNEAATAGAELRERGAQARGAGSFWEQFKAIGHLAVGSTSKTAIDRANRKIRTGR